MTDSEPTITTAPGLLPQNVKTAISWDPDGVGPAPALLVVGGEFRRIGNLITDYIAAWNPATRAWTSLGGANAPVNALAVSPSGHLIAGGAFTQIGGVAVPANVGSHDGTSWTPVGGSNALRPDALTVGPTGAIAGWWRWNPFLQSGSSSAFALWNGATWSLESPLQGMTLTASRVDSVVLLANGNWLAGVSYIVGTAPIAYAIRRWDGIGWQTFAVPNQAVRCMKELTNGDLVVGGSFTSIQGTSANRIARWNGTTWSALGTGIDSNVPGSADDWGPFSVLQDNGDLIVSGRFIEAGGAVCNRVARWNGTAWLPLAEGTQVHPLAMALLPSGDVVIGGSAGASHDADLVRFNGLDWVPVANGPNRAVLAAANLGNGDLVLGGEFTAIGGQKARHLARRTSTGWVALGSPDGPVRVLARLSNGDLVVAGSFLNIGGIAAAGIARWDGANWTAMDAGWTGAAFSRLLARRNGNLVAAVNGTILGVTSKFIAEWNGATWTVLAQLAGYSNDGAALAFVELRNGDLVAGGGFFNVNNSILWGLARWDGASWWGMGFDFWSVDSLALRDDGLVVCGIPRTEPQYQSFSLHHWDGASWSLFNPSWPTIGLNQATALPNGDLAVRAAYPSTWAVHRVGRNSNSLLANDQSSLHLQPDGSLLLFGSLTWSVGPGRYAELVPSCPASAQSYGTGCNGMVLAADQLPWLGGTFRATATSFGPMSIGITKVGVTQIAVPAATVFPQAAVGCTLLTTTDLMFELLWPSAGRAQVVIPVPATAALAGLVAFVQVGNVELDAQLAIASIADTNGLRVQLGSF